MTTTVKGLFKGIRYITHLFGVAHQKDEPEIEIGGPTDVKHVSHIGWNGPTTNPPSWMNQFKPDGEPLDPASNDENNNHDTNQTQLGSESAPPSPSSKRKKTKIKRRKASVDSLGGSITSKGSAATSPSHDKPKKHRKKKSKASTSSSSSIGFAASDNPAANR